MRSSPRRYVVAELIQAHGHQVLRLPSYHCEFNPHRNGMVFYDNQILRNGCKQEMVLETWQQSIENVTTENWVSYISHAEKIIMDCDHQYRSPPELLQAITCMLASALQTSEANATNVADTSRSSAT
ncbi:hypothetical protein CBL_02920 [Carabus blaptoides fortunei]